jgi:hypothetical protein
MPARECRAQAVGAAPSQRSARQASERALGARGINSSNAFKLTTINLESDSNYSLRTWLTGLLCSAVSLEYPKSQILTSGSWLGASAWRFRVGV